MKLHLRWQNGNERANFLPATPFQRYMFFMEQGEVIDIIRQGIYVLIIISAPPMAVALVVGLTISLLQALTQIQEATLTFVPKVVALLLTLAFTLPFMVQTLTTFTEKLQDKIVHIE
jgi:flagellar biosynthetic protein FliQ